MGREDLHVTLLDYLHHPAAKPLLLTGASGFGKSAIGMGSGTFAFQQPSNYVVNKTLSRNSMGYMKIGLAIIAGLTGFGAAIIAGSVNFAHIAPLNSSLTRASKAGFA